MTQEETQLLIKDLYARIPYGVKVAYYDTDTILEIQAIFANGFVLLKDDLGIVPIEEVQPYLFPLSSMTEKQKIECNRHGWQARASSDYNILIDWYNFYHFDHRGLIDKGLAIDATGLNIYR